MRLPPGADIDESSLSTAFSLSRTPLREVLRQLAGEGYVALRDNRGARAADMTYSTLRDFFIAAPMIYGAVLRLAAQNATPEGLDEMAVAQAEFSRCIKRGLAIESSLANHRFHEITGEMAGNVYLLFSFRRLLIDHARLGVIYNRPFTEAMAQNFVIADQQHDAIIEALRAGDVERSGELSEAHWELTRRHFEMYAMPQALDLPLGDPPQPHQG